MRQRGLIVDDLWVISVEYHMGDMDGNEWNEQNFLCVKENGALYFETKLTKETRVFRSESEAKKYLVDHDFYNSICFDNPLVIPLADCGLI